MAAMSSMPARGTRLATGDIVIATSRRDASKMTLDDAVGVVIRPEDLGAPHGGPLVLTTAGFLGDIGTALQEVSPQPAEDLLIVAGSADRLPEVVAELPETIMSITVRTDAAGEAVIGTLSMRMQERRLFGTGEQARRIADLLIPADHNLYAAARTCSWCPNRMPCAEHTIGGSA
jgi:hypothetical protein